MLLDGKQLLDYLHTIKKYSDNDTAEQIIEKIEEEHFNHDVPEEIESRMWIFERIAGEREYQNGTHEFPPDIRLSVLVEEVGEIAKELQEIEQGKNKLNLMVELIQTAAVCVRWIEELRNEK